MGCILGKLLGSSVVGNEESCLFKKRGLERLQVGSSGRRRVSQDQMQEE